MRPAGTTLTMAGLRCRKIHLGACEYCKRDREESDLGLERMALGCSRGAATPAEIVEQVSDVLPYGGARL
jgi:hypothetical protein